MLQIHITFACMLAPLKLLPSMKQQIENNMKTKHETQNIMQGHMTSHEFLFPHIYKGYSF
jgi:hypothetical protein